MSSVAQQQATVEFDRTLVAAPVPAYYCFLYDEHGIVMKVDGEILFLNSTTGTITAFEIEMAPWLTTLGEVGLAETQYIMDQLHGGAVTICTARRQEAL